MGHASLPNLNGSAPLPGLKCITLIQFYCYQFLNGPLQLQNDKLSLRLFQTKEFFDFGKGQIRLTSKSALTYRAALGHLQIAFQCLIFADEKLTGGAKCIEIHDTVQ